MDHFGWIFCDASYHPQHKLGIGGFLILMNQASPDVELTAPPRSAVQFITELNTNNIRMEIATVIAALAFYKEAYGTPPTGSTQLTVYSDCKNVCGLLQRRQKLEEQQYQSLGRATAHANSDIYRQFYTSCDEMNPRFVWLKGHCPTSQRDQIQSIFAVVDKAVRQELRARVKTNYV